MATQEPRKAASRPKTFADVLAPHPPEVQRIAERLRDVVVDALPEAREGIYGGTKVAMALYSLEHDDDVVCGIQPAAGRCLLYIHRVGQDDSPDLRLEGRGTSNRHVKYRDVGEVDPVPIRALIDLSVARRG